LLGGNSALTLNLNPSEINGANLNSIRREACRHFRNKRREYLKERINELATNRTRTLDTCVEE
jgi:hypothetical protein